MKSKDFERLKAVCEKEGFDVDCKHPESVLVFVKKKDILDGVEFIEFIDTNLKGRIYKILSIDPMIVYIDKDNIYGTTYARCYKEMVKPSTEAAYIKQLKKEAFERFGEIQDGDRFDCSSMGKGTCPITFKQGECDWTYIKEDDRLRKGYFDLYQSGKWAAKVKERFNVKFDGGNLQSRAFFFMYGKDAEHKMVDLGCFKVGEFLASQLEEYLNNEIE